MAEFTEHHYYALLDRYISVRWSDKHGPWPNDLNCIALASIVNVKLFFDEWLDPTGSLSKIATQYVGNSMNALGLENSTPAHFVESVKAFLILSAFCIVTWTILVKSLPSIWPAFGNIYPIHKQWYVVANLSKATFLGVMVLSPSWWKWSFLVYFQGVTEYPDHILLLAKYAAMSYIVTDAVALILVPKLPRSTVIHHYSSFILALLISAFDWRRGNVVHMINMYGFFSTLSFTTNAFLALRVMYHDQEWMKLVAELSFWTYLLACLGNWGSHATWLAIQIINWHVTIPVCLYALMLPNIVQDDCVLMKWLWGAARGDKLRRPSAEKEVLDKNHKEELGQTKLLNSNNGAGSGHLHSHETVLRE